MQQRIVSLSNPSQGAPGYLADRPDVVSGYSVLVCYNITYVRFPDTFLEIHTLEAHHAITFINPYRLYPLE